jgi:uncharacterized membrane protein YgdD (TMEM256/DUF423 family)
MQQRLTLVTGITFAGLGVVVGAFGAHAFREILTNAGRLDTFELAVRYQFYHAFALIITGLLMNQFQSKKIRYAAVCFTGGIVFFSGSLFTLCFTGIKALGAITPIGGFLFIIGWALLLLGVLKK